MSRLARSRSAVQRVLPQQFIVIAAIVTPIVMFNGMTGEIWWRTAMIAVGCVGAWAARSLAHLPPFFSIAAIAIPMRLALATDTGGPPSMVSSALDSVLGVGLIAILAWVVLRKVSTTDFSALVDLMAVTLGTSIAAWSVGVQPIAAAGTTELGQVVIAAAYLPMAILLVALLFDVTPAGARRTFATRCVFGAAFANFVAATFALARLGDTFVTDHPDLVPGTYSISFLLLFAAIAHPTGPAAIGRVLRAEQQPPNAPSRLAIVAASAIVPLAALAASGPATRLDTIVRTTATLLLMTAVLARLAIALHNERRTHRALVDQITTDETTALPTRVRFLDTLGTILDDLWRTDRQPVLIRLRVDRQASTSGRFDRRESDRALVCVAERLRGLVDPGNLGRVGDDDFALIVVVDTDGDPAEFVGRLRSVLGLCADQDGIPMFVTASVGLAVASARETVSAEELMRRAELAMHRAANSGRNRHAIFDETLQAEEVGRIEVEHSLHGAVSRGEMDLHHQPIIDLATGDVVGFEALMRWTREGGSVPPSTFIPVAEDVGTIHELGAWALERTLGELRNWIADGVVAPETTISVNVSPRQISGGVLVETVERALAATGLPPSALCIELTESTMLDDPDAALAQLVQVRELGVRIALDDFGTGFSSLSLLRQFPIDRLKIDRAFVAGLAHSDNDRSLVRTIVALARSMNIDVVAEGVESVEQLAELRSIGCHAAQGYLISRPVPPSAIRSTMVALDNLAALPPFIGSDESEQRSEDGRPRGDGAKQPTHPAITAVDGSASGSAQPTRPLLSLGSSPLVSPGFTWQQ